VADYGKLPFFEAWHWKMKVNIFHSQKWVVCMYGQQECMLIRCW